MFSRGANFESENSKNSLFWGTEDGWNPAPVEVGRLSHYLQILQGFIHQYMGVYQLFLEPQMTIY